MDKPAPGSREEDTWFSDEQLAALRRADDDDHLGSPIPMQMVSNGEYVPFVQTEQQKQVAARLTEIADGASRHLGISRRRFLAGTGGMAAAFIAMNEVMGRFFDVNALEIIDSAAAAEIGVPRDLFVFDMQLHLIRGSSKTGGLGLRALAQGPGPAATAAGFKSNAFNPQGYPDELGNPWSAWNKELGQKPIITEQFTMTQFIKDVFLDSHVTVGHLTNAPLGLFLPPGAAKPRTPHTIQEILDSENLTGYQTAAVRDFVNAIAGSTRLLAHGQLFPGVSNLDYMQQQIDTFHPDSWKGYTIAASAKMDGRADTPMLQWRLDDEKVAYPTYELIRKNRKELKEHPGFFNICIHKGLSTGNPNSPQNGNVDDLPKASRDWPEFNFLIYHSAWKPRFFAHESLEAIKSGKLREGVPDIEWTTQMAQQNINNKNVYAELGTTFAATVTTFPTVFAHLVGQLLKYWGPERIIFGTDALWYGSPQWQIEAFWRFQIPEDMAKKYGYPRLTNEIKRKILGINAARLYKLPVTKHISTAGIYKPVPKDFETRIPRSLQGLMNDEPAYKVEYRFDPFEDKLAKLKSDYAQAGGLRDNLRYGWVRKA